MDTGKKENKKALMVFKNDRTKVITTAFLYLARKMKEKQGSEAYNTALRN